MPGAKSELQEQEEERGRCPPPPQAASRVPVSHLWPSLQGVLHPLPLDLCCPLDRPLGLTVDTSLFPHSLGTRSGIFRRDTSYCNPHPVTSPLPSLWPPHTRRLSGLTRPPHGPLSGLPTPLCPAHPDSTPSCPSRVPSFSSSGFSPPAARSTVRSDPLTPSTPPAPTALLSYCSRPGPLRCQARGCPGPFAPAALAAWVSLLARGSLRRHRLPGACLAFSESLQGALHHARCAPSRPLF